jgi:PAS domain S-box-containing protein
MSPKKRHRRDAFRMASVRIVQFPLERDRDAASMARRARLLGVMAGLPRKKRMGLGKAVLAACTYALEHGGKGVVDFSVAAGDQQQRVEVLVREEFDLGVEGQSGASTPDTAHDSDVDHIGELVDRFRLEGGPGRPTVFRLAQSLPTESEPLDEDEVAQWADILGQKSFEDAFEHSQVLLRELRLELRSSRRQEHLRQELERESSESESLALLSLVASKTESAVAILDAESSILWVNDAFTRLTGYTSAEATDHSFADLLFGEETDRRSIREFKRSLLHGESITQETLQYRHDRKSYWATFNLTPVRDEDDRLSRWIAIGHDVTKRRQAEQTLQAAKETAEAASRSKSEFLANMSHEIRTPMNAIMGMTDLCLGTRLSGDQRDYLNTVKLSAESLLELLNDILDLSKIEAGKMELEAIDFNLADLLRETLAPLAVKAHRKGLELVSHLPMDYPQYLCGDPTRLRQILVNLVGNAVKFTERGEVVVSVEKRWQTEDEVSLEFSVQDTGIGIEGDKLERIFEAFTQADSSTTRQYGGTGLGLTITAELLKLMRARISVESAVGKGSTFHFSLRLKIASEPPRRIHKLPVGALAGKSVLVVDDNATNRRILEELLGHWGMRATLVENGKEAMRELQSAAGGGHPFELVLLDAIMPGTDGFDLARRIRGETHLSDGTIMMLSSADRPNEAERCRELGVESYVVKPVSAALLLDGILEALGEGTLAEPLPETAESLNRAERSLRVLVADDHAANRDLAAKVLEKRGHQCVHAADGNEALRVLERDQIDIVLMDIQMPNLDGFQATAAIRNRERESGTHLPIIALTAHAMKGDREKCLAAGMDAYLAKPFGARELTTLVESITSATPETEVTSFKPQELTGNFDFAPALQRLEGDVELLKEQMTFFLSDAPDLVVQIRAGLAEGDGRQLQFSAHRLKGLLASYDANAGAELAFKLEVMGREKDLAEGQAVCEELESQVADLSHAIERYMALH